MVKTAKRNVWSPKNPNSPLACRNACTARQKRGEQICRKRFSEKINCKLKEETRRAKPTASYGRNPNSYLKYL
jgi:hypothetical protein